MRAGGSGDRVARAGSSPTTRVPWRRNATPQQVSGTLVCSYRDGVAAVTWTTEADLREKRAQRSLFGVSGRWGRPPVGSSFTQSLSPSKRIFSRVVNDVSSPCSAITTSIFTARSTTGTFGNRDSVLKKANDTMAYFSEAWRYCTSLVPDWIRTYYANNPSSRLNRTLATTNRRKTAEAPAALLPAPAVRPRHRFVCLLALRLWPAVRCCARPRPPLRSGPKSSQTFPGHSLRSLGKLCAWTLHSTALMPAHISSARSQTERAATPLTERYCNDRHHHRCRVSKFVAKSHAKWRTVANAPGT